MQSILISGETDYEKHFRCFGTARLRIDGRFTGKRRCELLPAIRLLRAGC
jgi:hypothetical protein